SDRCPPDPEPPPSCGRNARPGAPMLDAAMVVRRERCSEPWHGCAMHRVLALVGLSVVMVPTVSRAQAPTDSFALLPANAPLYEEPRANARRYQNARAGKTPVAVRILEREKGWVAVEPLGDDNKQCVFGHGLSDLAVKLFVKEKALLPVLVLPVQLVEKDA